ncbi:MAG: trypsin-like peptidase domain-containing protein [Crenarchaeota archaeon]|nr:trypsin-like peptidase domain-containing protein [Thermoproteota archaeon]
MRMGLALAAVLAIVAISVATPLLAETLPLDWKDTGIDLAVGRRYTIALTSHCLWGIGCAKAIAAAGPIRIQLDGSHLTVWVDGEKEFDGDAGSEEVEITIIVNWDGSGTIILPDGSRAGFSLDRSYRWMKYEETVCFAWNCQSSKVEISYQELPRPSNEPVNTNAMPIGENPAKKLWADQSLRAVLIAAGVGLAALGAFVFLAPGSGRKALAAALIALAALAPLAALVHAEVRLYAAYPSSDVLKPGTVLKASIVVPARPQTDPNIIGVSDPSASYPDRFVAAYHTSSGATAIAVWIGKRGRDWSESIEVWKASASPGSRHEVRIVYSNGVVTFYVDGKAVYSFEPGSRYLRVIYYGDVEYSVVRPRSQATGSETPSSAAPQYSGGGHGSRGAHWLLLAAGLGIVALVAAVMIALARQRLGYGIAAAVSIAAIAFSLFPLAHASTSIDEEAQRLAYNLHLDKSVLIVRLGDQYGTGWWVSKHWIVTAAHVVNWKSGIAVGLLHGSWSAQGVVKYVDKQHDVAAIYVPSGAPSWAKTLPLCSSVRKGEQIIVLGYPFELIQLTGNLVEASANPRASFGWVDWVDYSRHIFEIGARTDAGNSGGPVLDYNHLCVVGIVSFALRGEVANMYYGTDSIAVANLLSSWNVPFKIERIGQGADLPPSLASQAVPKRVWLAAGAGLGLVFLIGVLVGMAAARGGRR